MTNSLITEVDDNCNDINISGVYVCAGEQRKIKIVYRIRLCDGIMTSNKGGKNRAIILDSKMLFFCNKLRDSQLVQVKD